MTTQVDAPPADSGNGAPKKNAQAPLGHCLSLVHRIDVSLAQRSESMSPWPAFSLGSGPARAHSPQGRSWRLQFTANVNVLSPTTVALCAMPVHPVSSTLAVPALPSTSTAIGQTLPVGRGVGVGVSVGVASVGVALGVDVPFVDVDVGVSVTRKSGVPAVGVSVTPPLGVGDAVPSWEPPRAASKVTSQRSSPSSMVPSR